MHPVTPELGTGVCVLVNVTVAARPCRGAVPTPTRLASESRVNSYPLANAAVLSWCRTLGRKVLAYCWKLCVLMAVK